MASIIRGYEYDIFISYRHKDNKYDGWVSQFVKDLRGELESTFKDDVSIYFDENPTDGLQETHDVNESLKDKIKCLVFIPILSRTYCDIHSFAWKNEFLAFRDFASNDSFGLKVKLANGNVGNRILPIRIHDLDQDDIKLFEKEIGGPMRPLDFIFRSAGVNRHLAHQDERKDNQNHTVYRDQINKVAMSVRDIITSLKQPKSKIEPSTSTPVASINQKSSTGKKIVPALLGLVLLCLVGYGIAYFFLGNTPKKEEIDRSIAVLPFADMSEKKDQEYFSDGLSEELLNLLSKTPDLKVISRTSAFSFKGKNEDIRSIGDKLNVAYILEGSVRKAADKLRITAQLIKVSDGTHLWSENYDREMNDIFKVQGEIASAVVKELQVKLIGNNYNMPKESDPRIYNLWLQSKFLLNLGTASNETFQKASDLLMEAYAIDSLDARVWSGLARVYFNKMFEALSVKEVNELSKKSRHAAEKSLGLDKNLVEVYDILSSLAVNDWNLPLAESDLQKALKVDPANGALLFSQANILRDQGRFTEAEELYKKSIELDPLGTRCLFSFSILYGYLGKYDDAIEQVRKALSIAPRPVHYSLLSNYYMLTQQFDKAIIEGQKSDPFWRDYSLIPCLWSLNRKEESEASLKKFIKDYSDIGAYQISELYVWKGENDKAFEWLNKAYEQHDPGLIEIKSSWFWRLLKSDDRYKKMLGKLNLPVQDF